MTCEAGFRKKRVKNTGLIQTTGEAKKRAHQIDNKKSRSQYRDVVVVAVVMYIAITCVPNLFA